uniref:G-protein coupled receptors family 1 profile domain-containing protein n=1 Tax=Taeniopygia guttata TaxID=59729 RepID=A0A674GCM9_TAEGU
TLQTLGHSSLIARFLPSPLDSENAEISQYSCNRSWFCLQSLPEVEARGRKTCNGCVKTNTASTAHVALPGHAARRRPHASTTAVPKMLALFLFQGREISFGARLTQTFFLHFTTIAESKILLAMAFDRFVSIWVSASCSPASSSSFIPHTYCEHMGIARLACADISANVWYGLTLPFSVGLLDLALIAISYGFILQALSGLPSCPAHLRLPRLPATAVLRAPHLRRSDAALRPQHPPELPILLATLYVLLAPLLSPVVYGMRTQQIRDRVLKVFIRP